MLRLALQYMYMWNIRRMLYTYWENQTNILEFTESSFQQAARPNLLHKFIAIEDLRYCTYLTSSFSCHERIAVNSEVSRNDYHQWIGELLADDGVIEWNTPKLKCWTRKFEGLLLHQSPQIVLHFSPWRLLTAIDCEYMKIVHKTSHFFAIFKMEQPLLKCKRPGTHLATVVQPTIPRSQEEVRLLAQARRHLRIVMLGAP